MMQNCFSFFKKYTYLNKVLLGTMFIMCVLLINAFDQKPINNGYLNFIELIDGQTYFFKIDLLEFYQSVWDPEINLNPPISINNAIKYSKNELANYTNVDKYIIYRISLIERYKNVWYYSVSFIISEEYIFLHPEENLNHFSMVVLMNGKVLKGYPNNNLEVQKEKQ